MLAAQDERYDSLLYLQKLSKCCNSTVVQSGIKNHCLDGKQQYSNTVDSNTIFKLQQRLYSMVSCAFPE